MAYCYDEKQHCRRKELNSRRDSCEIDDRQYRKPGNKKSKLVGDMMDDFHPDNSRYSYQCSETPSFHSELSVISDNGASDYIEYVAKIPQEHENENNNMFSPTTMDTSMNQVPDIANLADWITTDRELLITPLDERHTNYANNGQINEVASEFMLDHKLTEEQFFRIHNICQNILYRSSHGVLFLQDNKFFAKITRYDKKRRSAIKGYSTLKSNGEWENPWETTVPITNKDVQYRNNENEE